MYTKLENLKDIEEGKKELKKIFIDPIIQYIETKKKILIKLLMII